MKRIAIIFSLVLLMAFFAACSNSDMGGFQKNIPDPDFVLFEMFKDHPALDEIWDVMDQEEMNAKMAKMIKENKDDFVIFSRLFRDIMQDAAILPEMMKDTRVVIDLLRTVENRYDTNELSSFYDKSPAEYRSVMYALADRLRRDTADKGMTDSILAMARKVTQYMTDTKDEATLLADMSDLINDINDLERDDFILLTKNIGKVMAAASYPMYIKTTEFSTDGDGKFGVLETNYDDMLSYTNSGLGNAVKGTHSLLTGLRDYADDKIDDRDLVYDLIGDLRKTLLNPENKDVLKDFITTVEKHFTVGGSVYGNDVNTTNTDVNNNLYNTNSTNLYSDAELSNTLKETLAAQLGLLLRDDRCGALTSDKDSKSYALERFAQRLSDTGIDWKNSRLEESLYDIMVLDPYGRDRRTDSNAYAISFLEDFFFLGGITNNFGWKDGGAKNEVGGSGGFSEVCNEHTHGEPTNFITLNDSLFSMTSQKDSLAKKGTYELALENSSRAEHIFRSYRPFNNANKDNYNYKFYYDQNYGALDFVTGGAVGDLGLPASYNGGNTAGSTGDLNEYRPYNGNGIDEKELAGWTLGWVARACFEGEGPYYYKKSYGTKVINGKPYSVCMRPNGRIYAYVHYGDLNEPDHYIYPSGTWDGSSEVKDTVRDPIDNDTEWCGMPKLTLTRITGTKEVSFSTAFSTTRELKIKIGNNQEVTARFEHSTRIWNAEDVKNVINAAIGSTGICTVTGNKVSIQCSGNLVLTNSLGKAIKDIFGIDAPTITAEPSFVVVPEVASTLDINVDNLSGIVTFNPGEVLSISDIITKFNAALDAPEPAVTRIFGNGKNIMITGRDSDSNVRKIRLSNATGTPLQDIFDLPSGQNEILVGGPSGIEQRENRYRSSWRTDFYMITDSDEKRYSPSDLSGNTSGPGCLFYKEVIREDDPLRACSSQEEAIFRNYQWVMTEKKFVIVIPMWIIGKALGVVEIESIVFQIMEGHGFAGICPARKFRGNGVWAKANTTGESYIPGDYRMDVRVKPISTGLALVDADKIYNETLGFGPATYSVAFHALAPLYRLGFPRSPLFNGSAYATGYGTTGEMNFEHYQLGSKQFTVGDTNWKNRNMVMPLLAALINVLHESSSPDNKTVSNFTDGTLPLLKPLFIYNKYNKDISEGVCKDSFLPRVTGGATSTAYNFSHSKALIPEQFITGFKKAADKDPAGWFGGWSVRNYYMAKPMTTLFSSLIDRTGIDLGNPHSNREGRAGGILPLLTKYDINQDRSNSNQSPTRIVSNLVDQLVKMTDPKYDDKGGDDTQYANWGARRRILYGLEQMMSTAKMDKGKYVALLQERSKGTDVAYGGTATKMQRIPEWIFEKRDVDIDMDEILARFIGYGDPNGRDLTGKGLKKYHDYSENYEHEDWAEFDKDQADLGRLFDNLLIKGSKYCITEDLLDAADSFLSKNMTDDEIESAMYTGGKFFAWHDGSKWVWHGEEAYDTPDIPETDFAVIWRMLKDYLPMVHDKAISGGDGGVKYMAMLKVLSSTLKEDGLMPFLADVSLSADTEQLVNDLYEFLGEDFVIGGGAMWVTLADLMDDLADNVESTTPETVAEIYSNYGFQLNSY